MSDERREIYRRIEVVAKVGNQLRVLDLTDANVRKTAADAPDAKSLYDSGFANDD